MIEGTAKKTGLMFIFKDIFKAYNRSYHRVRWAFINKNDDILTFEQYFYYPNDADSYVDRILNAYGGIKNG